MDLSPSKIFYSQDSISNTFSQGRHNGTFIGTTLDDICKGRCTINDIPKISVLKKNGKWVTADNRRLWVFKHLERLGKCETVPVRIVDYIPLYKLTSHNGGTSIRVRRDPGGRWYLEPDAKTHRPSSTSGLKASLMSRQTNEDKHYRTPSSLSRTLSYEQSHRPNTNAGTTVNAPPFPSASRPTLPVRNTTYNNSSSTEFGRSDLQADRRYGAFSAQSQSSVRSTKYLVCALDFGTTYSGWAYSFKDDYEKDPTKAFVRQWHSGSGVLSTEKTPIIALVKPDGKTLAAFGYEAENEYKRLMHYNLHTNYYLFRQFKMTLYKKLGEGITRNISLDDELGKKLPAMDIFSMSIKYLADDLKENINQKLGRFKLDIDWVITVPAIWTDAAKQFMREAAEKAGISSERLTLSLEPEAASLYCRHLKNDDIVDHDGMDISRPMFGSKYLVFDAGGGTVDITLHTVGIGNTLLEVKPASGADCGGTMVDKAFETIVIDIVGQDVYTKFKTDETDEYLDFWRDFECTKRKVGCSSRGFVSVKLPAALIEIYSDETNGEMTDAVTASWYSEFITLAREQLRIKDKFFATLFDKSIDKSIVKLKEILKEEDLRKIHAIYMVGGFSQSLLLQKRIREEFPTLNIVVPHDASMCVLKGALIYGHNPTTISERVLKCTYGVNATVEFDASIHPISKVYEHDGVKYCSSVFDIHAKKGQIVHIGTKQSKLTYVALIKNQSRMSFGLYVSDMVSPRFLDDVGCRKIGEVKMVLEDPDAMLYPKATVCLTFSGTEIIVEAEEVATGKKITANANFLG